MVELIYLDVLPDVTKFVYGSKEDVLVITVLSSTTQYAPYQEEPI
jgi:hypothetical protein